MPFVDRMLRVFVELIYRALIFVVGRQKMQHKIINMITAARSVLVNPELFYNLE